MPSVPDVEKDIKDMRVAGCRVKLFFRAMEHEKWMVHGTVTCGIDEQAAEQSFGTVSYPTRDEAEKDALRQVAELLGDNVDRNTSRVNNWNEQRTTGARRESDKRSGRVVSNLSPKRD